MVMLWRKQKSDLLLTVLLLALFLDLVFNRLPYASALSADVALYLQSAELILDGKIPYRDFWDINPPLIMYLNVIPVFFARVMAWSVISTFNGLVLGLILFSAAQTAWIVRKSGVQVQLLMLLGLIAGSWLAAVQLQFGQREHLFAVAFIPYLLLRWNDTKEIHSYLAPLNLFLCSILACLKPSFFILLLCSEGLYFIERRRFKFIDVIFLLLPVSMYIVLFASLPWTVQMSFWTRHVPFVLAKYSSYDDTWSILLARWPWYFLTVPLFSAVLWLNRRSFSVAENRLLAIHALLFPLAFALAVLTKKAWGYHLIVVNCLLLFSGFSLFSNVLSSRSIGTARKYALSAAILTAFVAPYLLILPDNSFSNQRRLDQRAQFLNEILNLVPIDAKVVFFSTDPPTIYPALFNHRLWPGSRFLFFYPIRFFNNTESRRLLLKDRYPNRDDLEIGEKEFVDSVRDDIISNRPQLLYFPIDINIQPAGFDIYKYAEAVGWLDAIKDRYRVVSANQYGTVLKIVPP